MLPCYADGTQLAFEYGPYVAGPRDVDSALAEWNPAPARADLTAAEDARGWSYFDHDARCGGAGALNRVTSETSPDGVTTAYAYGPGGHRTSVAVESDATTAATYYAYDPRGGGAGPAGRMETAESSACGTAYYTYDANGRVSRKVLGNGCFTYFAYDPRGGGAGAAGRTSEILNCKPAGDPLCYFEYGYDLPAPTRLRQGFGGQELRQAGAASRITLIRRENGDTIYYGYDAADRLTSETWRAPGGETLYAFAWDYDAMGNRTYQSEIGVNGGTQESPVETYYAYNAANELTHAHALPADSYTYYAYDSRGNCLTAHSLSEGTQYFTYDSRDLVTSIRYRDGSAQYFAYDALMRMTSLVDTLDGSTTYYTWDKNSLNLLQERDATAAVIADYSHGHVEIEGSGSPVAARKTASGATYYQYPGYNGHGDTMVLTNAAGEVVARYAYNAWGQLLAETASGAPNNHCWQTNWIRLREGLYGSMARVYDANLGRFLQRDPLLAVQVRAATAVPPTREPQGLTAPQHLLRPVLGADPDLRPALALEHESSLRVTRVPQISLALAGREYPYSGSSPLARLDPTGMGRDVIPGRLYFVDCTAKDLEDILVIPKDGGALFRPPQNGGYHVEGFTTRHLACAVPYKWYKIPDCSCVVYDCRMGMLHIDSWFRWWRPRWVTEQLDKSRENSLPSIDKYAQKVCGRKWFPGPFPVPVPPPVPGSGTVIV